MNLGVVRAQANREGEPRASWTIERFATGLSQSFQVRNPRTDAESWGGSVGLIWMTGYWATLLPMWVHCVVAVLSVD
jgi:hypothetical protein